MLFSFASHIYENQKGMLQQSNKIRSLAILLIVKSKVVFHTYFLLFIIVNMSGFTHGSTAFLSGRCRCSKEENY